MTERELLRLLHRNPDLRVEGHGGVDVLANSPMPKTKLTEHDFQVALIAECDRRALTNPLWGYIFAIPNGGQRTKSQGGKLKAEGVRAGIPDLFLPVARRECHGLFIELKVGSNDLTKRQIWWIDRLKEQGYCAAVVWELQMAINLLEWYLESEDTRCGDTA